MEVKKAVKEKIVNLTKISEKSNSIIVVDLSTDLKLLNVVLRPEINVSAFGQFSLPKEGRDEAILKNIFDFCQRNNILHKDVVLIPHLSRLFVKRIQFPQMPESELVEAIKLQIKPELPFDISDASFDYLVIKEETKEDNSRLLDILCVAAPEEEIRAKVVLLKQAGFKTLSVNLAVFGYDNIISKYYHENQDEVIAVLHVGDEKTWIYFYYKNSVEFYRELPLSINKLRESLSGMIISDKGSVQLTEKDIEDILFNSGIPIDENLPFKDKIGGNQILAMLRPLLENLVSEIKRSFFYYTSQFQGKNITLVLLAGLGVKLRNLDKIIGKELSLKVERVSFQGKVKVCAEVNLQDLAVNASMLGLASNPTHGVNLLPHEFRTEKLEMYQKFSLRWVIIITFLIMSLSYLFAKIGIAAYQKRLDNSQLYLNNLNPVKQAKERIEEINRFIKEVQGSEVPVGLALKKISVIAGKDIFFDSLTLNNDSKTLAIKGIIRGVADNQDAALTKFADAMEKTSYFSDADITSVEKSKSGDTDVISFSINAKLE